ncbi:hypothetical protein [Rhizobium sp. CC-YZS058]|uniref:hypothetical protein n=1 Tax=Rhizobium sp. CC-YZS058 TaxID=3042153 RepID=UPI002B05E7DE|nr:hypothetical protein [Rhizobium sp. CC-YZS058]MEA3534265.1 hypothetical protein [Rhizobium sp. CC-YZS058]
MIRGISGEEVRTIKKATEAAYRLAGGVSVVATRTRASISQLSKYASTNPENGETLIPLDVAIEVDRAAGSPVIITAYAEMLGFQLVVATPDEQSDEGPVSEGDAHSIARKAMSLAEEIFAALEDGKVDAMERRSIVEKCYRLKRAVGRLVKRIGGEP